MLGQWFWSVSFAVLICVLLSETFPGHRSAAAYREDASAAAQCREVEHALERREWIDARLVLACRPPL